MKLHDRFGTLAALLLLVVAGYLFRPLLPVDETRYLTVAWEMFLRKEHAVLSLNFAPYHHKPPLLFWEINALWEVFGPSRWSALVPVFAASAAVLLLTGRLSERMFPGRGAIAPWILLGTIPFLAYSTLVMFDMTVTAFVLAALMTFLKVGENPLWRSAGLAGVLIGLGVLAKGPVMYLYVLCPALLYPFWRLSFCKASSGRWYAGVGMAVAVSLVPVGLWLLNTLPQEDGDFAWWLLWNQTAGRVTGNFSAAHVRPVWFYLMLAPLLVAPWIFHPAVASGLRRARFGGAEVRFLASAVIPVFVCFSLIAGKQPHYLLPLVPFIAIFLASFLTPSSLASVRAVALAMVILVAGAQGILSRTVLSRYDLSPVAKIYRENADRDWAFIRQYQGEIGFLARVERPLESLDFERLPGWVEAHPRGMVLARYSKNDNLEPWDVVLSIPYKGKNIAVLRKRPQS